MFYLWVETSVEYVCEGDLLVKLVKYVDGVVDDVMGMAFQRDTNVVNTAVAFKIMISVIRKWRGRMVILGL